MELRRSTGKVRTQQCRGVVGLPMIVLALVIGKGSCNNDEGCSNKSTMTTIFGLTVVVWCVERGLQYNFPHQMNIYLFCMKIWIKASRWEVGGRNIYSVKPTSTHSYCFFPISVSRCRFGRIFFCRCEVGGRNIYPAKPTSTHSYCFFPITVSRCRFGGKNFLHQTYIYSLLLLVFC